jgi:hypothetical protein
MYSIKNNNIILTRGDSFLADLVIYNPDGTVYEVEEDDQIIFALKRTPYDRKPYLTKEIDHEEMKLLISHDDTKNMEFGDYLYDIRLVKESGHVDTFITEGKFTLSLEVHKGV